MLTHQASSKLGAKSTSVRGSTSAYAAQVLETGPATEADMVEAFRDAEPKRWARRGYPDHNIFTRFPKNCRWVWASLTNDELCSVRHLNDSGWDPMAGAKHQPTVAVEWVHQHPDSEFSVKVFAIHAHLAAGGNVPPIVLVGTSDSQLVVLEGNTRTVAAVMGALQGDVNAAELRFLVGTSKAMTDWAFY